MKRIITNGKYNQVTCTNCGCIYSFEATDITEDKKVTCPHCDHPNTVDVKPKN